MLVVSSHSDPPHAGMQHDEDNMLRHIYIMVANMSLSLLEGFHSCAMLAQNSPNRCEHKVNYIPSATFHSTLYRGNTCPGGQGERLVRRMMLGFRWMARGCASSRHRTNQRMAETPNPSKQKRRSTVRCEWRARTVVGATRGEIISGRSTSERGYCKRSQRCSCSEDLSGGDMSFLGFIYF